MVANSMVHWSISLICPGPAVDDQAMGSLGHAHIDTGGECVRGWSWRVPRQGLLFVQLPSRPPHLDGARALWV